MLQMRFTTNLRYLELPCDLITREVLQVTGSVQMYCTHLLYTSTINILTVHCTIFYSYTVHMYFYYTNVHLYTVLYAAGARQPLPQLDPPPPGLLSWGSAR